MVKYLNENEINDKAYVFVIKNDADDCYDVYGDVSYPDSICMLSALVKAICNKWVPTEGYSVHRYIKDAVNAMIRANEAQPNDETERALKNLKDILDGKKLNL